MKRMLLFTLMMLVSASSLLATTVVDSRLQEKIFTTASDELIPVVVIMQEQADLQEVYSLVGNLPRNERREIAVDLYKRLAESTQADIRALLEDGEMSGEARDLRYLWIVNAIGAKITPNLVNHIASMPGVAEISLEEEHYLLPVEPEIHNVPPTDDITWSVNMVNGPAVWALGYNGAGVIVAVIDTGVNYNHLDLINRMWDGGTAYPHHGWDFYNNDNDPYDDHIYGGHGSHCSGIVAGDGTAGTQTGIAPGAEIMAVKVLNSTGNGTEAICWDGMQFALDRGADIISMSLGWVFSLNPDKQTWRTITDNLLAAGMVMSVAAGNEAQYSQYPIPNNIRTPGNCPPPWHHPDQHEPGGLSAVVTCAATNASDVRASFSSLGPCTWETISPWYDYLYQNGTLQGYVSPDIAAPGDNITSCTNQGNNVYLQMSGTSMATPQIAGIMALMLSKNPDLTPEQLDQIMELTAVPKGSPGKDNEYGSGRVNALAAVLTVPGSTPYDVEVGLTPSNPPIQIPANGGSFQFTIDLANNEAMQVGFVAWTMVTLPGGSEYGPILMVPLSVPQGWSASRLRSQAIPARAPSGTYTYHAYAGIFPDMIYSQDQFEFVKLADFDGGVFVENWDNWSIENGEFPTSGFPEITVENYILSDAYPNPFNPTANISFSLAEAGRVNLTVYDVMGRQVATLVDGHLGTGLHSAVFDAPGLSSGVYFYRLTVNDFSAVKKMLLMK